MKKAIVFAVSHVYKTSFLILLLFADKPVIAQAELHTSFPNIFPADYMLHAMDFILGCHPGSITASFASGVGAKSVTTGYAFNRADWSYIPGGIVSGTALIRPDFPELLNCPFLWQQAEYVLGGGTTDCLFFSAGG